MEKYRKPGHLAWRVISGQAFIVDARGSTLHELDDIGTFIWNALDRTDDPETIVSALLEEFEVSPETARADLRAFLTELRQKDLLEISE